MDSNPVSRHLINPEKKKTKQKFSNSEIGLKKFQAFNKQNSPEEDKIILGHELF